MLFVKAEEIGILSYFKDDNAEKEQKVMAEAEFGHSPYAYTPIQEVIQWKMVSSEGS